jgi:hypothetical protein
MSSFFNWFHRKPEEGLKIGHPTNTVRWVSVRNEEGVLVGLPKSWKIILDAQVTPEEQLKNPTAANQALEFYLKYSDTKLEPSSPSPVTPTIPQHIEETLDRESTTEFQSVIVHADTPDDQLTISEIQNLNLLDPLEKPEVEEPSVLTLRNTLKKRVRYSFKKK